MSTSATCLSCSAHRHRHRQDAPHLWHGHLWHENHATDVRYCHFSGHLWHAHLWGWACHRCLKSDICELIMMLFWPDAMQSLQIMMPMMILMRKLSKTPRSILKTGTSFTLEQVHSAPYRHCLINDYITSYKAIYILITKLVIAWRRPGGFTLTFSCGLKLSNHGHGHQACWDYFISSNVRGND